MIAYLHKSKFPTSLKPVFPTNFAFTDTGEAKLNLQSVLTLFKGPWGSKEGDLSDPHGPWVSGLFHHAFLDGKI